MPTVATPAWLKALHPVIITLWGNGDNDTEPELLTRGYILSLSKGCGG